MQEILAETSEHSHPEVTNTHKNIKGIRCTIRSLTPAAEIHLETKDSSFHSFYDLLLFWGREVARVRRGEASTLEIAERHIEVQCTALAPREENKECSMITGPTNYIEL